jgi:16S rRNA (guanine527-N7)-methyltransferase
MGNMIPAPPSSFHEGLDALGLRLGPQQIDELRRYLGTLLDANRRFNLTAVREAETAWTRHILDSLTLVPLLAPGEQAIDVGTGGGLPGMPLAIARPDLGVTLLEATHKKADFLKVTVQALGLARVTVVTTRAEAAGRDPNHRERYDVATARALGPLPVLLELAAPLVRVGGRVLAMKGQAVEAELGKARNALTELGMKYTHAHSVLEGQILELHKQAATPEKYPRRPGMPAKRPL